MFLRLVQAPLFTVYEGRFIHGAGIYFLYGLHELLVPLFRRSSVDAEYRIIFPGESVPKAVFKEGTGPYYYGVLSVMIQHHPEFIFYHIGKFSVLYLALEGPCRNEVPLFGLVFGPQLPPVVAHEEGIEHIGAYII